MAGRPRKSNAAVAVAEAPVQQAEIMTQQPAPAALAVVPRQEAQIESRKSVSIDPAIIESILVGGDLSKLTPTQRVAYYGAVCESIGLNPLTRPFDFINLNGKIVLYAKRDCTDQLRKIHSVSVVSLDTKREEGLCIVIANVKDKAGRTDSATGAVSVENLRGEALANALMKAETKSKRRATLSLCGLGILDESEIESATTVVSIASAPAIEVPTAGTVSQVAPSQSAAQEVHHSEQSAVAPAEEKPAGVPKAERPPESLITGESKEVVPPAPTPASKGVADAPTSGFAPLENSATLPDRIYHLKAFLFGNAKSEDRMVEYMFFALHPQVSPAKIEKNGHWNPDLWNVAMRSLADRVARMGSMETEAAKLGKEAFIQMCRTFVDGAKAKGVYVGA